MGGSKRNGKRHVSGFVLKVGVIYGSLSLGYCLTADKEKVYVRVCEKKGVC